MYAPDLGECLYFTDFKRINGTPDCLHNDSHKKTPFAMNTFPTWLREERHTLPHV